MAVGRSVSTGRVGAAGSAAGDPARAARSRGPATGPLVITSDSDLLDDVLAAAAAAGVEPTVMDDPASIRGTWGSVPMIIVGADRAARLADLVLPRRAEVFLAGQHRHLAELERWSGPLGAAVVVLPGAISWLTTALADVAGRGQRSGQIVGVVGGAGGVGCSTLAAALAVAGGDGDAATMVVDLDPLGGGIDLVMGAENHPGWRWPRLAATQGHLGDLREQLPRVGQVSVLASARGGDGFEPVGVEAVKAVLTAATRHHRMVVVDLPREPSPASREALRLCDRIVLITTADVRGVAGARQLVERFDHEQGQLTGLVVRRPRVGGIDPQLAARSLDLDLLGVLRDDPTLSRAAEAGEPPGRSARGPTGRSARSLIDRLRQSEVRR